MPNPDVSIEFDNGKINYRPGELLAGRVLVRVDSPLTVVGIHVSFKGDAYVKWITGGGRNRHVFIGADGILNFLRTVHGPTPDKTDRPTLTLTKGEHAFAFGFKIPLNRSNGSPLPGSFHEATMSDYIVNYPLSEGTIRYYVECHVERPALSSDARVSRDLHLSRAPLELSKISLNSQEGQDSRNVSCCCCRGGPIDVVIRTDKGGYLPGESMRVSARIVNGSRKTIEEAFIYFAKTGTYESDYGIRKEDEKILSVMDRVSNLKSKGMRNFDQQEVLVPLGLEPTSSPESCKVLYLTYGVILEVTPSGCTSSFKVQLPITIGSVPE